MLAGPQSGRTMELLYKTPSMIPYVSNLTTTLDSSPEYLNPVLNTLIPATDALHTGAPLLKRDLYRDHRDR